MPNQATEPITAGTDPLLPQLPPLVEGRPSRPDRKRLPWGARLFIAVVLIACVAQLVVLFLPQLLMKLGYPSIWLYSSDDLSSQMPIFMRHRLPKATPVSRTAIGVHVIQEILVVSKTQHYDESAIDMTLADPSLWCWPVDKAGNSLPIEPYPMQGLGGAGMYSIRGGEIEVRSDGAGDPSAFTFNMQNPGTMQSISGFFSPEQRQFLPLMIPLQYWMYYSPGEMPTDYASVLRDLRLRPIDGRLADLLKTTGPLKIYKHPTLPVIEAQFPGKNGPESLRIWADPEQNWGYIDARYFHPDNTETGTWYFESDPASTEFEYWFTIEEDHAGPELPANVTDPARQLNLYNQTYADYMWRRLNNPINNATGKAIQNLM